MDFVAARASRRREVRGDWKAVADWRADGAAALAAEGRLDQLHRSRHRHRDALLASANQRSGGSFAERRPAESNRAAAAVSSLFLCHDAEQPERMAAGVWRARRGPAGAHG